MQHLISQLLQLQQDAESVVTQPVCVLTQKQNTIEFFFSKLLLFILNLGYFLKN